MMEKEFGIELPDAYLLLSVCCQRKRMRHECFIGYVLDKITVNVAVFDNRGGGKI